MISSDLERHLLFVEPSQPKSQVPVIDDLTRKMTAALRAATTPEWLCCGIHECVCGAASESHDYVLPDGRRTNSLCVHYLAFHRAEVPPEQLQQVSQLISGEEVPSDFELNGGTVLSLDELSPEQRQELLELAESLIREEEHRG